MGVSSDSKWTAQPLQTAAHESLDIIFGMILNLLQLKFGAKTVTHEKQYLNACQRHIFTANGMFCGCSQLLRLGLNILPAESVRFWTHLLTLMHARAGALACGETRRCPTSPVRAALSCRTWLCPSVPRSAGGIPGRCPRFKTKTRKASPLIYKTRGDGLETCRFRADSVPVVPPKTDLPHSVAEDHDRAQPDRLLQDSAARGAWPAQLARPRATPVAAPCYPSWDPAAREAPAARAPGRSLAAPAPGAPSPAASQAR